MKNLGEFRKLTKNLPDDTEIMFVGQDPRPFSIAVEICQLGGVTTFKTILPMSKSDIEKYRLKSVTLTKPVLRINQGKGSLTLDEQGVRDKAWAMSPRRALNRRKS